MGVLCDRMNKYQICGKGVGMPRRYWKHRNSIHSNDISTTAKQAGLMTLMSFSPFTTFVIICAHSMTIITACMGGRVTRIVLLAHLRMRSNVPARTRADSCAVRR